MMTLYIMTVVKYMIHYDDTTQYQLEVKINFEFKKGVGIAIKSKETSS